MENLRIYSEEQVSNNIVPFRIIEGGQNDTQRIEEELTESCEVYAFKNMDEIRMMINQFDENIDNAMDEEKMRIAERNKLLFLVGINIGIRASDLRLLKWSFFIDGNGNFRDSYTIKPVKTRKKGKFITLYFNQTVRKIITDYLEKYPTDNLDEYLFSSRKGDEPIIASSLWRIIKQTARQCGIIQNIGSHSLRKTWAYFCYNNAVDKSDALVMLQECFNHSSSQTTLRYIGIIAEKKKEMYNSVDIGLEML